MGSGLLESIPRIMNNQIPDNHANLCKIFDSSESMLFDSNESLSEYAILRIKSYLSLPKQENHCYHFTKYFRPPQIGEYFLSVNKLLEERVIIYMTKGLIPEYQIILKISKSLTLKNRIKWKSRL